MREKRHITFLSVAVSSLMFAFTAIAEDTPITKGVGGSPPGESRRSRSQ